MIRITLDEAEFLQLIIWYLNEKYPDIVVRTKGINANNIWVGDDQLGQSMNPVVIDLEEA